MWSVQLLESIVRWFFIDFGKLFFQSGCIFLESPFLVYITFWKRSPSGQWCFSSRQRLRKALPNDFLDITKESAPSRHSYCRAEGAPGCGHVALSEIFEIWNLKFLKSEILKSEIWKFWNLKSEIWNLKILKSGIWKFWILKSENFGRFFLLKTVNLLRLLLFT